MTSSEILNIAVTVGIIQLLCDLVSNYFVYNGDNYKRNCSTLERTKWKYDKAVGDSKKNPDKNAKRLQRAKDDYGEACSNVARKHTGPGVVTSIVFVILLRILAAEHTGKIMAFLPIIPFDFISNKITSRGVNVKAISMILNNKYILLNNEAAAAVDAEDFDEKTAAAAALASSSSVHVKQITTFLFIYILSTFSIKYYVNKIFGTSPPSGADKGIMSVMESPRSQRMLKSMGVDPEDYKME